MLVRDRTELRGQKTSRMRRPVRKRHSRPVFSSTTNTILKPLVSKLQPWSLNLEKLKKKCQSGLIRISKSDCRVEKKRTTFNLHLHTWLCAKNLLPALDLPGWGQRGRNNPCNKSTRPTRTAAQLRRRCTRT